MKGCSPWTIWLPPARSCPQSPYMRKPVGEGSRSSVQRAATKKSTAARTRGRPASALLRELALRGDEGQAVPGARRHGLGERAPRPRLVAGVQPVVADPVEQRRALDVDAGGLHQVLFRLQPLVEEHAVEVEARVALDLEVGS